MHYNCFQDYDPSIGRYIESDPIGLECGINTYGYVGGNAINFYDRYGLDAGTLHLGVQIPFIGGLKAGFVVTDYPIDVGIFLTAEKEEGGLGKGKATIGISQTFGSRCNFDGVGAEQTIGIGEVGGSHGIDQNSSSLTPTSISAEVGPQLGYSVNKAVTFSLTARDLGRAATMLLNGYEGQIVGECECNNY